MVRLTRRPRRERPFGVSGSTCWRRLRGQTEAGIQAEVHHRLLDRLRRPGQVDRSFDVVGSASVRALFLGVPHTGPSPADRGKKGC